MLRGISLFRAPQKRPHQKDDNNESAIPVDTSPIYATVKKLKGRSEGLSHTTCSRILGVHSVYLLKKYLFIYILKVSIFKKAYLI